MQKRLQMELKQINKQTAQLEADGILLRPELPNDLTNWTLRICFKERDSLYFGQVYSISMRIPQEYPFKPPRCKFVTQIFHPNIKAESGEICLNIINESENEWTPANTLCQVAYGLQSLVNGPNCDSPLNLDAGSIFRNGDLRAYKSLIGYFYPKTAGLQ